MPIPVLGALAAGVGKKLVGKALRWATRGKLLGQGGGAAAVKRVGGAVLGATTVATTAAPVIRAVRNAARPRAGEPGSGYEYDPETGGLIRPTKTYRRMNYVNPRALNRAIRRLGGAEKIFRKIFSFNHGTAATRVRPKFKRRRA